MHVVHFIIIERAEQSESLGGHCRTPGRPERVICTDTVKRFEMCYVDEVNVQAARVYLLAFIEQME